MVYNVCMITLTIDRGLKDSVYQQVADQIRNLIASGNLPPGTVLPSVRQLARDLSVNLNTIARAYRALKSEGFLEIKDRSNVTVAAPAKNVEESVQEKLVQQLRVTLVKLLQAGVTTDGLLALIQNEVGEMNIEIEEKEDD